MAVPSGLAEAEVVWGTSLTDVYVGDMNGATFHFNGSVWTAGFHDPGNMQVTGLYESPSGKVYIGTGSGLFVCTASDCTNATNYALANNYANLGCGVFDVCGNGETVYATGATGSDTTSGAEGCLLTTDGMGNWNVVNLPSLAGGAGPCTVAPNGTLYAGGLGAIVSYTPLDGATPATINWPDNSGANANLVTFQALWADGTNAFAAGGSLRLFQLGTSGWNDVVNTSAISEADNGSDNGFLTIAGAGGQAWAFGDSSNAYQAAVFNGAQWNYVTNPIAPGDRLDAAWAADATDYFAVGVDQNLNGVIWHGHP